MPISDNEFYKGVQEGEPTLNKDQLVDEFHKSDETISASSDLPPTIETENTGKSAKKNKSGLKNAVKMLKLAAAAIVTVSIAGTSLTGGGNKTVGSIPTDFKYKWPQISYSRHKDDDVFVTAYSTSGEESYAVQFSIGGVAYRLEDPSKSLSFIWMGSYRGETDIMVHDYYSRSSYTIHLSQTPYSADEINSNNAYGTISSTLGDVFYIEAISHTERDTGIRINSSSELSSLMHQLVVRSRIEDGKEWGKVHVGDIIYSDLNETWCGNEVCDPSVDGSRFFFNLTYSSNEDIVLEREMATLTANDITWKVYYQKEYYHKLTGDPNDAIEMIWVDPQLEGESLILALNYHRFSVFCNEKYSSSKENQEIYGGISEELMMSFLAEYLHYYHISPPEWYS